MEQRVRLVEHEVRTPPGRTVDRHTHKEVHHYHWYHAFQYLIIGAEQRREVECKQRIIGWDIRRMVEQVTDGATREQRQRTCQFRVDSIKMLLHIGEGRHRAAEGVRVAGDA